MYMLVLLRRDVSQGPVSRLRPALAQVPRDGRNRRPLHRRVPVDFGTGNNVLRVPVVSLVVDELARIAEYGRRGQPALILDGQLMQTFQIPVELHRVGSDR